MNKISNKNPFFSVLIPTFNAEKFIERAFKSLKSQTFSGFEVIIVDDVSTDSTVKVLKEIASVDERVRFYVQEKNSGTLASRARGVSEANGEYILLMDQDDELASDALENLQEALKKDAVDILHFGVKVEPESESACMAAIDCENWLTPKPRRLEGKEILNTQFSDNDNFDWLVHHKVFKSELAKAAWKIYENEKLCTSDDFLMSFILCYFSKTYRALPNSKWYIYHLGAGETFGGTYTVDHWKRICDVDAKAFDLIKNFFEIADGCHGSTCENAEILQNCQNKLIEHVMNEMHDNLFGKDVDLCIEYALKKWDADAAAGELWRFVRDRAYADLDKDINYKKDARLKTCLKQAEYADKFVRKFDNKRYIAMKDIARAHLEVLKPPSFIEKVLGFGKKE